MLTACLERARRKLRSLQELVHFAVPLPLSSKLPLQLSDPLLQGGRHARESATPAHAIWLAPS